MDSSTTAAVRDWGALPGPEICPAGCLGCVPLSDSFSPLLSLFDPDLGRPLQSSITRCMISGFAGFCPPGTSLKHIICAGTFHLHKGFLQ